MMISNEAAKARGRLGRAIRDRKGPDVTEPIRAELKAAVLADHVARVVASAPPLTQEQRSRIAALLVPVSTTEAA